MGRIPTTNRQRGRLHISKMFMLLRMRYKAVLAQPSSWSAYAIGSNCCCRRHHPFGHRCDGGGAESAESVAIVVDVVGVVVGAVAGVAG